MEEKLYKVYHRNYQSIWELYDDLRNVVLEICFENNKIVLHYSSDTLEIEPTCCGEYVTYLNGKREAGEWEDQDIYFYALDFVHEKVKGRSEIEVYDTSIVLLNDCGITYVDEFGRTHLIEYSVCAANGPSVSCVAERDITKRYFRFYTSGVQIKVVFDALFVFKKGKKALTGGRKERFAALRRAINNSGYTSYDLA